MSQKEFTPHHEKKKLWAVIVNSNKAELYPFTMEKILLLAQKLNAECLYIWFTKICLVFKTQIFRRYL